MSRTRKKAPHGGGRGGDGGGRGGRTVVIDTLAPLEMFRRFLVRAAKGNVAEAYRQRKDVFPCSYGAPNAGGGGGNGRRERRRTSARILVDADGDVGHVMDAVGHPIVRSGVGLLLVPPGGRVRRIDYRSASGGTSLTWRWDPDHAYRCLGRVSGTATNWSLECLGVAGVVTPQWAAGQGPIMRAKRERAARSWPVAPDLRTMGFNRRDRRIVERRDLESGARLWFPTGYEDDGGRKREPDGSEIIRGLPAAPDGAGRRPPADPPAAAQRRAPADDRNEPAQGTRTPHPRPHSGPGPRGMT